MSVGSKDDTRALYLTDKARVENVNINPKDDTRVLYLTDKARVEKMGVD
jgi:hypothetical protein